MAPEEQTLTSPTHALVGLAIGSVLAPRNRIRAGLLIGAVCAVAPDLDLLAPYLGGDRDFHRRLTHSVSFAVCLWIACGAAAAFHRGWRDGAVRLGATATLAVLSHAFTDLLTTYRMGVALLSPFSASRFALPWRPIDSLTAEAVWAALPAVVVLAGVLSARSWGSWTPRSAGTRRGYR